MTQGLPLIIHSLRLSRDLLNSSEGRRNLPRNCRGRGVLKSEGSGAGSLCEFPLLYVMYLGHPIYQVHLAADFLQDIPSPFLQLPRYPASQFKRRDCPKDEIDVFLEDTHL